MTRKDYVKFAAVLREAKPAYNSKTWDAVTHGIAQVLGEDNPRFDYSRFYKACGRE